MKKKKIIISVVCLILVAAVAAGAVFAVNHFKGGKTVADKVSEHYDDLDKETFSINLADYTDFDWDFVLIYRFPITAEEISNTIGVEYTTEHDLESGMIFIKTAASQTDGEEGTTEGTTAEETASDSSQRFEIVYEETFVTDFENPYEFVIYPYTNLNSANKARLFPKEQAVFNGKKIMFEGEARYLFVPDDAQ